MRALKKRVGRDLDEEGRLIRIVLVVHKGWGGCLCEALRHRSARIEDVRLDVEENEGLTELWVDFGKLARGRPVHYLCK